MERRVTTDQIHAKFVELYKTKKIIKVTYETDPTTGVVTKTETPTFITDADIKQELHDIVTCLTEAILDQIRIQGLAMGVSNAKELRAGE